MPFRTILVEDELLSREFLKNILNEFCPETDIVAVTATRSEAISAINNLKPDLVFMDIELQNGTGFDVLRSVDSPDFQVIFTTGSDHHSLRAIRFSGIPFLLKPIGIDSLKQAIEQLPGNNVENSGNKALSHLFDSLQNNGVPEHLYVPGTNGGTYLAIRDIICMETHPNGTDIHLRCGHTCTSTLSLKELEHLMEGFYFFRSHAACLINIKEIASPVITDSLFVKMTDGTLAPVSPKRKDELLAFRKTIVTGQPY